MQEPRLIASLTIMASAVVAMVLPGIVRVDRLGEQPLGQQLYVSPTGSDNNPGSAQEPFRTIPKAAQAAAPGTTVHVAPGVYGGGFRTVTGGSVAAPIRYRSAKQWGAKIVPSDDGTSAMAWDNRGDYVTIEGFEVDGTTAGHGTPWTIGIYAAGSHDIVIHNNVHNIGQVLPCTSHGGSGIGTDHYYFGVGDDVIGNLVHDIGPKGCAFFQGIYISTSGDVVNNVVYNAAFVGIHLWHDATNVNIINNTVAGNSVGVLVGAGDQYHSDAPDDFTKVVNNIVANNRLAGIQEHGKTGMNNLYLRNLVWSNGKYNIGLQNALKDSETVEGDPKFREYGTDFRLLAGSAAIDAASPSYAPAVDAEGVSRPKGEGYDIGAYEYAQTTYR